MDRWPWVWGRWLGLCRQIKNVYERSALDADPKSALPPRWMWWDGDELDAWFDERREAAREDMKSA